MKTLEIFQDRETFSPQFDLNQLSDGVPSEALLRNPKKAALLSVVPGLGQIYNGETGKGLVFLAVTLVNLTLLLLMAFSQPMIKIMGHLAANFHMQLNADLLQSLAEFRAGSPAFLLYLALFGSYVIYAMREAYDHARQRSLGKIYAQYYLGLPETASGSYLLHYASTLTLLVLALFVIAPPKPQEQAIDIELVKPEPPPPAPKAPTPEPPKQAEKPPEPVKEISPVPPKPNQIAVATPTTEPAPLAIAPAAPDTTSTNASSSGDTNNASGGGANGDSTEVDFGPYLQEMQRRIKKAWFPPKGNESKRISVKFKIKRNGDVSSIRLVESSGLTIADDAATTAVQQAAPFPPLPAGADDEITIKFTFDYNVFNGSPSLHKL